MSKAELSDYYISKDGKMIWPSTSSIIWEVTGWNHSSGHVTFEIRKL